MSTITATVRDDVIVPREPLDWPNGTPVEVTAIREVDGRVMSGGKPGPVTRRIQETFNQAVRGQLPQYRKWLSFIRQEVRA